MSKTKIPSLRRSAIYAPFQDPNARCALFLRLGIVAEAHISTLGIVFGVTPQSAGARLLTKRIRSPWLAFKAARSIREERAKKRRVWWRRHLSDMGIDPHSLDETDPAWALCWRKPRGALVLKIAAEMRAEHVDESNFHLDTTENLIELLRQLVKKQRQLSLFIFLAKWRKCKK